MMNGTWCIKKKKKVRKVGGMDLLNGICLNQCFLILRQIEN